ncbi:phage minor head protein [Pseudomonas aeruginosa]|uniref:phage head morphogenesis protein n=1 Tax=Pseudomonas aeruginosa TaxID=287 RepID=UPI001F391EF3|nr:phage minor head protein [Pseudomonas aeruginosa]
MQSAYMAGRYAAAYEARETHPYWMYVAVMDGVTRPSHAALHGKVFRWDDPIWQHITPPMATTAGDDGGRCPPSRPDRRIQPRPDGAGHRRNWG